MAGIYIHIPFCKQRCNYCDFYKTTQVLKQPELVNALCAELKSRKSWLENDTIETIYFGGGTPSLLSTDEIKRIIDAIFQNFNVSENSEITLESNPDDLTKNKLSSLKTTAVNRLSIGIQSFQNEQLVKMNRRHTADQALTCVKDAQDIGFSNISTDLIYGLPNLDLKTWEHDLMTMAALNIQHLSAYHLTYEEGTVFDTMLKKGALKPLMEDDSIEQFKLLINWAKNNDFEHYEISNFAKSGLYSRHNTSYWQQKKYLGIGPSAHSYNANKRLWNTANLNKYLQGIANYESYNEFETLSKTDKYNEYLMTGLRTQWGIDLKELEEQFGTKQKQNFELSLVPHIKNNSIFIENNRAILSNNGIFISDSILADLIVLQNND